MVVPIVQNHEKLISVPCVIQASINVARMLGANCNERNPYNPIKIGTSELFY